MTTITYDCIIIGGSYAGLSAAMTLGRSRRQVLVIDAGKPCNRQTPHSHNFLTQDGKTPAELAAIAKEQVLAYPTITLQTGVVKTIQKNSNGFGITTDENNHFSAFHIVLATGIIDVFPDIPGIRECWGISVVHCPYCHGYEVKDLPTAILANGDMAAEYIKLISNWTEHLTLLTNGESTLNSEQVTLANSLSVQIIEKKIASLQHTNGHLDKIVFNDNSSFEIPVLYYRPHFEQSGNFHEQTGCALTEQGFYQVNNMFQTTVPGIFAIGDNTTPMRSVANAVAAGNMAGAVINKELIEARFAK